MVEQHVVSGIAYSRDEAKVSIRKVKDQPGVSASVFGPLAEADISVDMIVQNISPDGSTADITFTVARKVLRKTIEVLNGQGQDRLCRARSDLAQPALAGDV